MHRLSVLKKGLAVVLFQSTDAACVVENTYVYGNIINVEAATTSIGEIVGNARNVILTNCGSFGNIYKGVAPKSKAAFIASDSKTINKITNCYSGLNTAYVGTAPGVFANNHLGVTTAAIADGSLAYALAATSGANWVQNTYP
jgi:hypothetical protein